VGDLISNPAPSIQLRVCRPYRSTAHRGHLDMARLRSNNMSAIAKEIHIRSSTFQCHGVRLLPIFPLLPCFRKSSGSHVRKTSSRKHFSRAFGGPMICDPWEPSVGSFNTDFASPKSQSQRARHFGGCGSQSSVEIAPGGGVILLWHRTFVTLCRIWDRLSK
jgi:hypothetical protein